MSSIAAIISDLEFGRLELLKSIEGLSQRELTETAIYPGWTIKDVLAHVVGWDRRVIDTLPLMVQNRAGEIPGVEVEEHNRASVESWRDKSLAEVLAEIKVTHQQITTMLATLDHVEIDMRRQRRDRTITIRSYVIDVMMEHERQHAVEIEQWRKELEKKIDPGTIKQKLAQNRIDFLSLLAGLSEPDLLDKRAIGQWSVKDVVSHVADWEWRMLSAARHIYDPSLPAPPPIGSGLDDRDEFMISRRRANAWDQEFEYLGKTGQAVDEFVARLKPADWRLRGPYPWPDDQGTIAELVTHMAEHYSTHLPGLERWRDRKKQLNPRLRPWVRWRLNEEATGALKKLYAASIHQSGKVWNIIRLMSLRPSTLQAALRLYTSTVQRNSRLLGRMEREMIGLVVSQLNDCHYCIQASLQILRDQSGDDKTLDKLVDDWRTAGLPAHVEAALVFAEKLTLSPAQMSQQDVRELRQHGYSDEEIHDIVQTAAFFGYVNRVATALGIPPEDDMEPWPREDGDWSIADDKLFLDDD